MRTRQPANRVVPPSEARIESLWNGARRAAEELTVAFSGDGAERIKALLREGVRKTGQPPGSPTEVETEVLAGLRRLLAAIVGDAGGTPRLIRAAAIDAALGRLAGTWSGAAAIFFEAPKSRPVDVSGRPLGRRTRRSGTRGAQASEIRRPAVTFSDGERSLEVQGFGIAGDELPLAPAPAPPMMEPPPPPPPPAPEAAEPPRTAYARLDAPEVVAAGVEIEVVVGLAEQPSPGVTGGPMTRPASSVGDYTLGLQLVADGFRLREGENLRPTLPVTAAAPYPTASFHLTPEPQQEKIRARTLQAFFEVGGQTLGMAVRSVAVVQNAGLLAGAATPAAPAGVDVAVPTDAAAPDLEIRILLDPDHDGRLLWTFNTPHAGIELPDKALATDIGREPQAFAHKIVDGVNGKEGKQGIYNYLSGIGQEIADAAPPKLWDLLRAVAAAAAGTPNVLILSQEPYVPWELAWLQAPLLDPAAPPFLAAQVNLGRWVLSRQESVPGSRQRPRQPPPTEVAVHSIAVVSGVYDQPGWNRLKEAEGEAADLHQRFGATEVDAKSAPVFDCLAGTPPPPADLLHFAVHGIYDPNGMQDGLMLTDGETLDPFQVEGTDLGRSAFVFLNACQVGSGNKVLGDYAGMAAAFLKAGAAGVVAPLWSVKDTLARQIALAFYEAAAAGTAPAAALRSARKAFKTTTAPQSATWLAYQFFGHPALKLRLKVS